MSAESPGPRIALLLGAGASAEAGVPTVAKLTALLESLSRDLPDAGATTVESIFHAARLRVATARGVPPTQIDFEAAVGVLAELAADRVTESSALFVLNEQVIDAAVRSGELRPAIERIFALIRSQMDTTPERTAYLDPLIGFLCHTAGQVDVFTLNYDLAFELALRRQAITYADGFPLNSHDKLATWDRTEYDALLRWKLHKLHGSVDWVFLRPFVDEGPWTRPDSWSALREPPVLARVPAWRTVRPGLPSDSFGMVSAMNLGTRKEILYASSPYTEMFWRFERALDEADLVIACGYSFRDERINRIVEDALSRRMGRLGLVVVDPAVWQVAERIPSGTALRETGRLLSVDAALGEAVSNGSLEDAVASMLRKTCNVDWATVAPKLDESSESITEAWDTAREIIDACLLHQVRIWERHGLGKTPLREQPEVLGEINQSLSLVTERIGELVRIVEDARAAIRFEKQFEFSKDSIPRLIGPARTPSSADILMDLPGYLRTLWYRFHEPLGESEPYRIGSEILDRLDDEKRERLANTVAKPLGDVVAILSDVHDVARREIPTSGSRERGSDSSPAPGSAT